MSNYDFGTGGYDILYNIDATTMSNDDSIIVCSTMAVTSTDADDMTTAKSFVYATKQTDHFEFTVRDKSGNIIETYLDYDLEALGTVRVIAHGTFITIYVEDKWIHTFSVSDAQYPVSRYVALKTSGASLTVTDVRLKELADWREAVWIDMEQDSMNAISSVVLQRPVDIYPTWDGKLAFAYDPERDTVSLVKVTRMSSVHSDSQQACSDGIVYFTDTAVVIDPIYARDVGFTTRMFRLPDLGQDAIEATRIIQERNREARLRYSVSCRLSPQLEYGDIANIAFTKAGTGTSVDEDIIVENLNFTIEDGAQSMTVEGRIDA